MTREFPAKPVQARALRTRANILEAAIGLFARNGFPETSMDEIAQAAGTSKGGLYHHFGTKGAILAAVAKHLAVNEAEPATNGHRPATNFDLGRLYVDLWAEAAHSSEMRAVTTAPSTFDQILAAGQVIASQTRGGSRQQASDAAA